MMMTPPVLSAECIIGAVLMTDWWYRVDTGWPAENRECRCLHLGSVCLHWDAPVSSSTAAATWPLLQPSACIRVCIPAATSINYVNLSHSCHLSRFNVARYMLRICHYWHCSQPVADCLPACVSAVFTVCHQSHNYSSVKRFHYSLVHH